VYTNFYRCAGILSGKISRENVQIFVCRFPKLAKWVVTWFSFGTLQFKMADGRHIENRKFAISPEPFIRSRNFPSICRLWLQDAERLKFAYFKYSRWRTAAIVEIENLQSVTVQPIGTKFCRHADCEYKTCG